MVALLLSAAQESTPEQLLNSFLFREPFEKKPFLKILEFPDYILGEPNSILRELKTCSK